MPPNIGPGFPPPNLGLFFPALGFNRQPLDPCEKLQCCICTNRQINFTWMTFPHNKCLARHKEAVANGGNQNCFEVKDSILLCFSNSHLRKFPISAFTFPPNPDQKKPLNFGKKNSAFSRRGGGVVCQGLCRMVLTKLSVAYFFSLRRMAVRTAANLASGRGNRNSPLSWGRGGLV